MELELQNGKIEMFLDAASRHFEAFEYAYAEECLHKALALNPNNFSTLFQFSKFYYSKRAYELAEFYLLKTVHERPDIAGIFSVLGIVQKELGKYNEAEQSYLKAIQLNPDFFEAYYNLGILFYYKKQFNQAIDNFNKAIVLNNNLYLAHYNLGNVYRELEKYDEAVQHYSRAVQLKDDFADGYYNMGVVIEQLFDHQKALRFYDLALTHDKNHVVAHWNRAVILLLLQNYEEGFKEYEWRKKKNDYPKRIFSKPELAGENIKGKTVFVYDDQGLGDTIQFSRYLIMLKKLGASVIFECDKNLSGMFNNFQGIDQLIEKSDNQEPELEYGYHISLLSLPHFFRTSYQTIPTDVPYLSSDRKLTDKWERIIGNSTKVKVGLVWAGNPYHTRDKHRSINFSAFEKLLLVEGVEFYSLQKYVDDKAVSGSTNFSGITELEIVTFADTAAIINNLDLVISVDTSVAHLAGAMGKPIWNLIYYYPDWRWGLEGSTTPWYPSMKLFRQPNPFNWQSVLEDVEKELKIFVQQKMDRSGKIENHAVAKEEVKILYAGLGKGNNFGWGVCSKYLKKELSKKITLINFDEDDAWDNTSEVDGTVLHALIDIDMNSLFQISGKKNVGYTFFENELTPLSHQNLKKYDLVLVGSTWNKHKLEQAGIANSEVLIQGIDPEIFYPTDTEPAKNQYFKIFSGGKFELRKGQDLVLKAIKILQQKYRDIVLVNAWYNYLPSTMTLMSRSKHLNFELVGEKWEEYMSNAYQTNSLDRIGDMWKEHMLHLYKMNSIDAGRILTFPLVSNQYSRDLYKNTDLGLFPNRAEGGTNLVLMEYMACGKPVIASFSTGHKDILTEENSIPLKKMKEYKIYNERKELIADWEEADIDEIISQIEYAYFHRDEIKKIGLKAAADLKQYTWKATSDNLLNILNRY